MSIWLLERVSGGKRDPWLDLQGDPASGRRRGGKKKEERGGTKLVQGTQPTGCVGLKTVCKKSKTSNVEKGEEAGALATAIWNNDEFTRRTKRVNE